MTDTFVPFQPNVNADGTANAAAGKDDAILYGAVKPDPGGLPLGTLEYLTFSRFFNAPGAPFDGDGEREVRRGHARGRHRRADACRRAGPSTRPPSRSARSADAGTTTTFTVTPAADAAVNTKYKIAARYTTGAATGYTDDAVRARLPRRGPLPALGQVGGVRQLARQHRSGGAARRPLGRAQPRSRWARRSTSRSTSTTGPTSAQSGTVSLTLPANFTADRDVEAVRAARPRRRRRR